MIKAFWMLNSNFGDNLNHFMLTRLASGGMAYAEMSDTEKKIVAIGSILNWCDENCIAWGCGLANRSDGVNPNTKIHAVRGPLSRERAIECGASVPKVFGDPALLLPSIYRPEGRKKYRVGLIPHYVDQAAIMNRYSDENFEIRIIDILDTPERVIEDIVGCEQILSSSLHGIITAHAYGIPAAWVKFSDKIGGDGMKYLDYFLSVDCPIESVIDCSDLPPISELQKRVTRHLLAKFRIDVSPLIESCPFPLINR